MDLAHKLQHDRYISQLSTGYMYGLQELIDMKDRMHKEPRAARWRSLFMYRTARALEARQDLDWGATARVARRHSRAPD